MWKERSRKWSEEKVSSSKATVPTMFGATVSKFVRTVEYPRLATIWGRKLLTLARGTPNDRLIIAQTLNKRNLCCFSAETQMINVIPIHWIFKWLKRITDIETLVDDNGWICQDSRPCHGLLSLIKPGPSRRGERQPEPGEDSKTDSPSTYVNSRWYIQ